MHSYTRTYKHIYLHTQTWHTCTLARNQNVIQFKLAQTICDHSPTDATPCGAGRRASRKLSSIVSLLCQTTAPVLEKNWRLCCGCYWAREPKGICCWFFLHSRIGINAYIFWSSPWDYLLILNWLTSCSALFIWYLHIDGKTMISCRLPLQSVSGGCTMLLCSFIFDASTSILHAPCLHPRQNPRSQGVLTSSATRRFAGAWCSSAGFSGMRRPWNGDPEIIHGKPLVYHIYIYIIEYTMNSFLVGKVYHMNFQSQLGMVSEDVFLLLEMGGDKSTDYSRLSFPGARGSVCGHVAVKLGISNFERFRLSRWGWFNYSENDTGSQSPISRSQKCCNFRFTQPSSDLALGLPPSSCTSAFGTQRVHQARKTNK
jgi:hypothetical protein